MPISTRRLALFPFIAILLSGLAAPAAAATTGDVLMHGPSPLEVGRLSSPALNARIGTLGMDKPGAPGKAECRPGGLFAPAAGPLPPAKWLDYEPTAALRRQIEADFIARYARIDPQAAAGLAASFQQHDVEAIYSGIVGPLGLSSSDTGDIVTAYAVLGWMIANDADRPSTLSVRAVRGRLAARLAASGEMADPAARAQLGEELKILFVMLHAGWQDARREGRLADYRDGVAQLFRRQAGGDPRAIDLTDHGFQPRG